MKSVGIIGGIAPASTIAYYEQILAAYRERRPDGSAPSIIINSIDLKRLLEPEAVARGARPLVFCGQREVDSQLEPSQVLRPSTYLSRH